MPRVSRFRSEKQRLLSARDAALSPRERMELGAVYMAAARTLFMAGMAARGFTRQEALKEWRRSG